VWPNVNQPKRDHAHCQHPHPMRPKVSHVEDDDENTPVWSTRCLDKQWRTPALEVSHGLSQLPSADML
jgi:hypothetical protein